MKALKGLKVIPRKSRINSECTPRPGSIRCSCTWNFNGLRIQPVGF